MNVPDVLFWLLILTVIFINGWTDAPNAIATAVGSGSLTFRRAVLLAAICNFAGAALSSVLFPAVAATIHDLVRFSNEQIALTALCGALLSIILWAVFAWRFGLPTSESHGLLAGLSGGALAMGSKSASLNADAWCKVLIGMLLSLIAGILAGRLSRNILIDRIRKASTWQKLSAAAMAALHGVQDGQKFAALLLMASCFGGSDPHPAPLPLSFLVAGVMALGTALGGKAIVEKVGTELTSLTPTQGLAADVGAGAVLTLCSILGLPVSTTHAKVSSILGAGDKPSLRVAGQIMGAWILTFPVCALIAFLLTKLMLSF